MDTKEKAPRHGAVEPNQIIVNTEPTDAQHNGQQKNSGNGQTQNEQVATGSVIGVVTTPYDRMPAAIFHDERLGPTALGILCYVFSRPPNWDVSVEQLNRRFHGHRLLNRRALKQIEQTGWGARAVPFGPNGKPCGGQMWFFRCSLNEPWPSTFMNGELEAQKLHFISKAISGKVGSRTVREPTRLINTDTDNKLKRNPKGENAEKGAASRAAFSSFGTEIPKSEAAMLATLREHGIRISKDFACRFWADMQRNHWTIRGQPVRNWIAALQARREEKKAKFKNNDNADPYGLRRIRINGLKRLRCRVLDERNALWRSDPKGNRPLLDELDDLLGAIDQELDRKTGRTDAGKIESQQERIRALEQEHAALKHQPILPDWLNGSAAGSNGAKP